MATVGAPWVGNGCSLQWQRTGLDWVDSKALQEREDASVASLSFVEANAANWGTFLIRAWFVPTLQYIRGLRSAKHLSFKWDTALSQCILHLKTLSWGFQSFRFVVEFEQSFFFTPLVRLWYSLLCSALGGSKSWHCLALGCINVIVLQVFGDSCEQYR